MDDVLHIEVKLGMTAEHLASIDPKTVDALIQGIRAIGNHLAIRPTLEVIRKSTNTDHELMTSFLDQIKSLNDRVQALETVPTVQE